MDNIIWDSKDCQRCKEAHDVLIKHGVSYEIRPAEQIVNPKDDSDREALSELAFADGKLPVVMIENGFVDPDELDAYLTQCEECGK